MSCKCRITTLNGRTKKRAMCTSRWKCELKCTSLWQQRTVWNFWWYTDSLFGKVNIHRSLIIMNYQLPVVILILSILWFSNLTISKWTKIGGRRYVDAEMCVVLQNKTSDLCVPYAFVVLSSYSDSARQQ